MIIKSRKDGFTLVEVLISLVILSIGLLAIAQLQVAAVRTLTLSRNTTTATLIGEQQLEFLRAIPTTDIGVTPIDNSGNSIVDAKSVSIFRDDSRADLQAAAQDQTAGKWRIHPNNPVNSQGESASTDEFQFWIRWNINRMTNVAPGIYNPGTEKLKFPGLNQMVITLEVFWWEHPRDRPSSIPDDITEKTIKNSNGHLIRLTTAKE